MKTFNYDAFRNPVQTTVTGKLPAAVLHSDGIYDPALAPYHLPIRRYCPVSDRFTSPDIHAGEATAPASLQRFGYSGETPIHAADPA